MLALESLEARDNASSLLIPAGEYYTLTSGPLPDSIMVDGTLSVQASMPLDGSGTIIEIGQHGSIGWGRFASVEGATIQGVTIPYAGQDNQTWVDGALWSKPDNLPYPGAGAGTGTSTPNPPLSPPGYTQLMADLASYTWLTPILSGSTGRG